MKRMTIRIAASSILLSAFLLSLACSGPQTTDQNSNRSNSATNSNSNSASLAPPDCSGSPADKIVKIKDGVKKNIDKDPGLKKQHDAGGGFTYDVKEDPPGSNQIVMTFSGRVGGQDQMLSLVGTANGYMRKGCVDKVSFASPGAPAAAGGFEWQACDYPNVPCPGGQCLPSCMPVGANTNANTGSNSGNKNGN